MNHDLVKIWMLNQQVNKKQQNKWASNELFIKFVNKQQTNLNY